MSGKVGIHPQKGPGTPRKEWDLPSTTVAGGKYYMPGYPIAGYFMTNIQSVPEA